MSQNRISRNRWTSLVLAPVCVGSLILFAPSAVAEEVPSVGLECTEVEDSSSSNKVRVTESGLWVNDDYITEEEFDQYLNSLVYVGGSCDPENMPVLQTRALVAAPGIYFIPGIGQIAIAATGGIIVAGVAIAAGSWLAKKISTVLADRSATEKAKIRGSIPTRIRDNNGNVRLEKFTKPVRNSGDKKESGGWRISPDLSGHGGSKWKLFDSRGKRIASLGGRGEVLRG